MNPYSVRFQNREPSLFRANLLILNLKLGIVVNDHQAHRMFAL